MGSSSVHMRAWHVPADLASVSNKRAADYPMLVAADPCSLLALADRPANDHRARSRRNATPEPRWSLTRLAYTGLELGLPSSLPLKRLPTCEPPHGVEVQVITALEPPEMLLGRGARWQAELVDELSDGKSADPRCFLE